jgi:hypothetical protein
MHCLITSIRQCAYVFELRLLVTVNSRKIKNIYYRVLLNAFVCRSVRRGDFLGRK